jgi:hypothetical protein
MTTQKSSARKITVTRETLARAAHCNETWKELYVAVQTHLGIEIQSAVAIPPNGRDKGDSPWQAA